MGHRPDSASRQASHGLQLQSLWGSPCCSCKLTHMLIDRVRLDQQSTTMQASSLSMALAGNGGSTIDPQLTEMTARYLLWILY